MAILRKALFPALVEISDGQVYHLEAEEHGEGEGEEDDRPGDGLQYHAHQPQPGVTGVA